MRTSGYYSAGRFREDGSEHKVFNPYNREQVGLTWLAGEKALEESIAAAESAKGTYAAVPLHQKARWLKAISDGIRERREEFASMIALESGKPLRYAHGEADRGAQTFRIASEEVLRQPGEYLRLDWTAAGEGKEGWVKYFPAGLVAGISPFNFPLNLAAHKVAPALAAGCPIILKPSSSTPMTALMLAEVAHHAGVPAGVLSVLPMNRDEGDRLVTDPRFAILSFTGSPAVGWKMKERAGKKKTILELGGNAGVIVGKSADMDLAVKRCLFGGFAFSGQVCIHTQRIFVHKDSFEEFASRFAEGASKLKQGDPIAQETEISSMIDEDNAKRVEEWIEEAVQDGAKLVTGGNRQGTFVEPTVLSGTKNDMKVCSLEVFGPVVTIDPFDDFNEALARMNDTRYGLQAGVFTNSIKEMDQSFNSLEVGGVVLNDVPTFRVDHMPYGGIKDSGLGREGVYYSMREMLEPKILVK